MHNNKQFVARPSGRQEHPGRQCALHRRLRLRAEGDAALHGGVDEVPGASGVACRFKQKATT